MNFQTIYNEDLHRYVHPSRFVKRFHKYFRKAQTCNNPLLKKVNRYYFRKISAKYGLEIDPDTKIVGGLYIGHPYNITINPKTVIGRNLNIHKGVVIGQENRGKRKGTPTIGNNVWIGINAAVVGNVVIGDDVLIAPNSYVNCDVPSHSVVFGNPCIIKHKENATQDYVNRAVSIEDREEENKC